MKTGQIRPQGTEEGEKISESVPQQQDEHL